MNQQCSLTDEQIEAIALDTLEFFGLPEYEVALSQAQVLGFARAVLEAASRQATQPRQV
ncbi:hypothetical protein EDC30_1215 [Paucimonas lemoignei]|uniref:Uncharacterized protein n=1 Tax=Paucimonas lemoignei TaxID=29443 RepID=A0A4R3HRZ8_PAULE|nr:hypothetical protein [Paucimonas lemoignei]TCS32581.1 hypothetical protein EDC30_1215 [Paucimonas lemoignei]